MKFVVSNEERTLFLILAFETADPLELSAKFAAQTSMITTNGYDEIAMAHGDLNYAC
jgi:hypothetical protein